eukprot:PhF_6_TR37904/c0_g2_i5/m.56618/K00815/TAT; tyrosine aminotransferase
MTTSSPSTEDKKRPRDTDDDTWTELRMSETAARTSNPIRNIVDRMTAPPNPNLRPIKISIGDPTLDGNLLPPVSADEAVTEAVKSHKWNGYGNAHGHIDARKAVAQRLTSRGYMTYTENDVAMFCGASGALDIAIRVLANPGDNILIPSPGFSLYAVVCQNGDIQSREYHCLPDKGWEVDLDHVRSLIDGRTKAILINNPSNPCGSVFSESH